MDDLIRREAAIDAIEHAKTARSQDGEIYVAKLNAEMNIQILPSAERKKGEWEVAIGYDQNKKVMCTECRLMSYEPTPFCPNCGAEMRGEEDG